MSEANRVILPREIQIIADNLQKSRSDFLNKFELAMGKTVTFSQVVSNAIGDISIEEAKRGIIDFFEEQMRMK